MLPKARRLGISWMTVGLLGVGVGLTGIAFIPDNHIKMDDPETLFIIMSQILFHPLVGGFLLVPFLHYHEHYLITTISNIKFIN